MPIDQIIDALRQIDNEAIKIVLDRFESDRSSAEAWKGIDEKQANGYHKDALALIPVIRRLYNHYVDPTHKWYPGL